MTLYARCNLAVLRGGNQLDGASIEVRSESTGLLATLYSDRNGSTPLGNPFVASDGGDAGFHVIGGAYKITATKGVFEREWRYVGVGLAQESDITVAISGPGISTDNTVPRWDGTSGSTLQGSSVTIDDSNNVSGIATLSTSTSSSKASVSGVFQYNLIHITSDQIVHNDATGFVVGLNVAHVFGGSSVKGGREALQAYLELNAATSSSNANRNYVAGQFDVTATDDDGGTNTTSGAKGALFGFGAWADAQSGATNLLHVAGGEIDVSLRTGSSARFKTGLSIASHALDAVDAADVNAALQIGAQSGSVKWAHGIIFSDMSGFGVAPIKTTGTLIGTGGTATVANGVDLTGYTISNNAFASNGFNVNGSGLLAAAGVVTQTVAGGSNANSAAEIRATFGNGVGSELVKITGGDNGGTTFATFNSAALTLGSAVSTLSLGDTSSTATIKVNGGSTNANLVFVPKGSGGINMRNDSGGDIAAFSNAAGATGSTNRVLFINAGTGGEAAVGADNNSFDANVNLQIFPKGTGVIRFVNGSFAEQARVDSSGINLASSKMLRVNGTQVVTARQTGWGSATGTATRTTFATGSVTLPALAEHVKALIDDLTTHGLIGT